MALPEPEQGDSGKGQMQPLLRLPWSLAVAVGLRHPVQCLKQYPITDKTIEENTGSSRKSGTLTFFDRLREGRLFNASRIASWATDTVLVVKRALSFTDFSYSAKCPPIQFLLSWAIQWKSLIWAAVGRLLQQPNWPQQNGTTSARSLYVRRLVLDPPSLALSSYQWLPLYTALVTPHLGQKLPAYVNWVLEDSGLTHIHI